VTSSEFRERLSSLAERAGVAIATDRQDRLEAYFRLLEKWNAKINLTALPLRRPTDETLDRLLIEPLAAAPFVADSAQRWFDIGSGGGSPAIPLKIAHPTAKLIMIESKERKAAFLREAIRVLDLSDTDVENGRFEDVLGRFRPHCADLVSVRALKSSPLLFDAAHRLLGPGGRLLLFHSAQSVPSSPSTFDIVELVRLRTGNDSRLSILKPMFHVEHSD
jgi:16S rRNA (guanine527-N7)-methyltransferase